MGFMQPSDYGNIENRRAEQNKILKWKNRAYLLVSFVFSILFVHFAFSNTNDFLSVSHFFVNWNDLDDNSIFYSKPYLYSASAIVFILIILFLIPSKKEMIRRFEVLGKRNKKPSITLKIQFKIISAIDKVVLYAFFPVSYFIFNVGEYSKSSVEKFYLRAGWFSHIENSFFKEVAVKVDGYKRAKELVVLTDYKELFSTKRGDGIYSCHVYQTIYKIFLSESQMNDLIAITEGYIGDKEEPKYDKLVSRKEYKELLKKKYDGDISNFRCYNGIDEILFSFDLIKDIIDSEAKRYKEYMYKYATSSRQTFTRTFMKNYRYIKQDKKLLKKIANYNLPDVVDVEELQNDNILTSRIIELCEAYFRIVMFKVIMGQYINLPSGTMVVKIEDYTARMIIEMFDEEALIQIVRGKNDGQSKDFNSDALVNIFLASYNYFILSSRYSTLDLIHDVFNFRDEVAESEIDNTVMSGANIGLFSEGYRAPTEEEMKIIRKEMEKKFKKS